MLREWKRQLAAQRPDVQIVGDELHALGRVKDFAPYASKIVASGAQAVITGNWGNDLTLLVKAAARGRGSTVASTRSMATRSVRRRPIGDAGIGRVLAVADWLPNVQTAPSAAFLPVVPHALSQARRRYVHMRSNCWSRRWRKPWSVPAATIRRPWRVRSSRPTSRWPASAAACGPPITSSSSRWWWG